MSGGTTDNGSTGAGTNQDGERGFTRTETLTVAGGVFGVLPLVFCGMRILSESDGDLQKLRLLLQNLDVKALILATVLPVAGTLAFWTTFILLVLAAGSPKGSRKRGSYTLAFLCMLPIAITVLITGTPTRQVQWNVGILAGLILVLVLSRVRKHLARPVAALVALALVGGVFAGAITITFTGGMWLPTERLTLKDKTTPIVYVLSSDDTWTKYMDRDSREIRIIQSSDITKREFVPQPT